MKISPPLQSLAIAFRIPLQRQARLVASSPALPLQCRPSLPQTSFFSTTPKTHARNTKGPKIHPRISPSHCSPYMFATNAFLALIRYHLHHPLTPRPLRFSRTRALRHWTIHRAAQLVLHRDRGLRERELERQYNAMRAAMEELRLGVGDGGRLYRQAVTRKGIYGGLKMGEMGGIVGNGGIPVEYARGQTDGPPRGGFDHEWTRG